MGWCIAYMLVIIFCNLCLIQINGFMHQTLELKLMRIWKIKFTFMWYRCINSLHDMPQATKRINTWKITCRFDDKSKRHQKCVKMKLCRGMNLMVPSTKRRSLSWVSKSSGTAWADIPYASRPPTAHRAIHSMSGNDNTNNTNWTSQYSNYGYCIHPSLWYLRSSPPRLLYTLGPHA